MENQHQKITGYRNLTQAEIDLINKINQVGALLQALTEEVQGHIRDSGPLPHETSQAFAAARWAAMASTDFQTGLMALTRAVARPSSF